MNALTTKSDLDFIARFLSVYKNLNEESQNLVLAFVQGMELQREIAQESRIFPAPDPAPVQ